MIVPHRLAAAGEGDGGDCGEGEEAAHAALVARRDRKIYGRTKHVVEGAKGQWPIG